MQNDKGAGWMRGQCDVRAGVCQEGSRFGSVLPALEVGGLVAMDTSKIRGLYLEKSIDLFDDLFEMFVDPV
jgi:hypothetical protein